MTGDNQERFETLHFPDKDSLDRVENLCELSEPMMAFLTIAAGLKWQSENLIR